VIAPIQRLPIFLRASLLGLLMLAVVCKPLSSLVCETHQLGHLLAAAGHASFHDDSIAELQLDADHARGDHGLVHARDQGGAYADIAAVVTLPVVHFESVPVALPTELPVPAQRVTRLFRPPIA
jgi:hypothetical protein